jgi:hypothetical protein
VAVSDAALSFQFVPRETKLCSPQVSFLFQACSFVFFALALYFLCSDVAFLMGRSLDSFRPAVYPSLTSSHACVLFCAGCGACLSGLLLRDPSLDKNNEVQVSKHHTLHRQHSFHEFPHTICMYARLNSIKDRCKQEKNMVLYPNKNHEHDFFLPGNLSTCGRS